MTPGDGDDELTNPAAGNLPAPSLGEDDAEEAPTDAHAEQFTPESDPGLSDGGARPEEPAAEPPQEVQPPDPVERLPSILESLLLAADRPLTVEDLCGFVGERNHDIVAQALTRLQADYEPRGIQLAGVAGGFQLRTNPVNAPWVQRLLAQKPVRLTRAQLETLAIVGYRQPITRPEIDEIRGVDSGGTLKTLLDRALVRILGKKEEPGRPLLYGTTKEFLTFFNLRDLADLPTLREFHELSEEHQAQVAALEEKATPGTIEPADGMPPPLARVELAPEVAASDEDLAKIDALIGEAGARADGAARALGVDPKGKEPKPEDPPASPEGA